MGNQLKKLDELLKETIREHNDVTQRLDHVEQQQKQTNKVVEDLQTQQKQTNESIEDIRTKHEELERKTGEAIGEIRNKAGQTWVPSEEGNDVCLC